MKRVWNYVVTMWQPASALIVSSLFIGLLFSYRLGTLVPGASQAEIAARTSSISVKVILNNPINAPYKTAQLIARHIHSGIVSERLVSGLAAGITVLLFYLLATRFYNKFSSAAATLLYATSTSLLLTARLSSTTVTLLLLFVLFICGYRLRFSGKKNRNWIYSALILGLALYTPGLIYFIIAGILWQFRAVKRENDTPKPLILGICSFILILLLVPLVYGFVHSPSIWHEYLGIPSTLPNIVSFVKSILAVPAGILVFAPENPVYRLGKQPTLDAFSAVLFIVGYYKLLKKYRLDRFLLFTGIFIISIFYTAISSDYENSIILLPFIFLIIGIGISYLLDEWNKVFPNNPLARWLALLIMSLAILVTCNFQTRRYFIAWPHNSATKAVFKLKS